MYDDMTEQEERELEQKEALLQENLQKYGKLAVAYSGGIDSHFLLEEAIRALGRAHVLAVLCQGVMLPEAEAAEARRRLETLGVRCGILDVDVLAIPQFASNDRRRCYYCKKHLMGRIQTYAWEQGFETTADGKNADDARVYRPGAQAAQELGICSPLFESGFTKRDIRACARRRGIDIWNKPSQACLASRFPYDTVLTAEKLKKVERAEQILKDAGFADCRVRAHDAIARIEVPEERMAELVQNGGLAGAIRALGFAFVTLDLEGLRSGVFD